MSLNLLINLLFENINFLAHSNDFASFFIKFITVYYCYRLSAHFVCECFVGNLPLNLIFSLSVALAISVFLRIPFRLGDVVKKKEKARKRE